MANKSISYTMAINEAVDGMMFALGFAESVIPLEVQADTRKKIEIVVKNLIEATLRSDIVDGMASILQLAARKTALKNMSSFGQIVATHNHLCDLATESTEKYYKVLEDLK